MPLAHTILAIQEAFASGDPELQDEARQIINDPDCRKEMLENHGIDTSGMTDDEILTTLEARSRDSVAP
jgi:hypothetical protein